MTLRWGVIGTGGIASAFATDLRLQPGHEVAAVGSRSQESADAFGDRFDVATRHASYEDLVGDPEVDVVYVATPHPGHHDATMLAITAGKHVLCEKPFTLNATEAKGVVAAARAAGVFCMEAMWTRHLPAVVRVRELLASGGLGDVRLVTADFSEWFAPDPSHRLFDPGLGGGALLDLGVYPVSFASMVLGPPTGMHAVSTPTRTGVDELTSMILEHEGGRHALLCTGLAGSGSNRAVVVGTEARIELDRPFFTAPGFTMTARDGRVVERFEDRREGNGLRYQAVEVARCVGEGRLESDVMPLDETVTVMATLDAVRRQIGLVYPQEKAMTDSRRAL